MKIKIFLSFRISVFVQCLVNQAQKCSLKQILCSSFSFNSSFASVVRLTHVVISRARDQSTSVLIWISKRFSGRYAFAWDGTFKANQFGEPERNYGGAIYINLVHHANCSIKCLISSLQLGLAEFSILLRRLHQVQISIKSHVSINLIRDRKAKQFNSNEN